MNSKLIIGLGNPGSKYEGTRHNFGERVLKNWARTGDSEVVWKEDANIQAEITRVRPHLASPSQGEEAVCIFPLTSMNTSGRAVAAYLMNHPTAFELILIVHDDMELPLGEIKLVPGGSAKGHNGTKSIHEAVGTQDIPRLRLGIGRPPEGVDPRDYVLGKFGEREEGIIAEKVMPQAIEVLSEWAGK